MPDLLVVLLQLDTLPQVFWRVRPLNGLDVQI